MLTSPLPRALAVPSRFSRSRSNTTRSATSDYIDREDYVDRDRPQQQHNPTRPVDKDKAETELQNALKKATNPDETAPKQKHVRSESRALLTLSAIAGRIGSAFETALA